MSEQEEREKEKPSSRFSIFAIIPIGIVLLIAYVFWDSMLKGWIQEGYYGWVLWSLGIVGGWIALSRFTTYLDTEKGKPLGDRLGSIFGALFFCFVILFVVVSCSRGGSSSGCTPSRYIDC